MAQKAGMPEYQPTYTPSVRGNVPQIRSKGGAVLNEVGNMFYREAQGFADQNAIRKGTEAGENPGFKPTLNFGRASELYNQAALQANKYSTGTDIINTTNKLYTEAQLNPDIDDAIKTYDAKLAGYSQGLFNTLPEENKGYAKNLLSTKGFEGRDKLNAIRHQKLLNEAQAGFNDTYGTYLKEMENNAAQGNTNNAMVYHGQIHQLLQHTQDIGALTPLQVSKYKEDSEKQLHINDISGQYKKLKTDSATTMEDLGKFRKDVIDSPALNKIFDPEERRQLIALLDRQDRADALATGLSQSRINYDYKNMLFGVKNGGKVNEEVLGRYMAVNPDMADVAEQDVADAQAVYNVVTTATDLPLNQQVAYIEKNFPTDPESPNYGRQVERFDDAMTSYQQKLSEIQKDKVAFFQKQPAFEQLYDKTKEESQQQSNPNALYKQPPINQYEALIAAQLRSGYTMDEASVLTKPEALQEASELMELPITGKVQYLNALKNKYGEYYPIALRDIMNTKKVPDSLALMTLINPNDPNIKIVSNAYANDLKQITDSFSAKDKKTIDESIGGLGVTPLAEHQSVLGAIVGAPFRSVAAGPEFAYRHTIGGLVDKLTRTRLDDFNDFCRTIPNSSPRKADFVAASKDYITRVAYQARAEGANPDNAVNIAAGTLVDNYNMDKIGAGFIRVPKQYSMSAVKSYAKKQEKYLKDFPYVNGTETMTKNNAYKYVIKEGQWATNTTNDGLVYVDNHTNPVTDKYGHKFQFYFKDAINNDPSIIHNIYKHIPHIVKQSFSDIKQDEYEKKLKELGHSTYESPLDLVYRSLRDHAKKNTKKTYFPDELKNEMEGKK